MTTSSKLFRILWELSPSLHKFFSHSLLIWLQKKKKKACCRHFRRSLRTAFRYSVSSSWDHRRIHGVVTCGLLFRCWSAGSCTRRKLFDASRLPFKEQGFDPLEYSLDNNQILCHRTNFVAGWGCLPSCFYMDSKVIP